MKVTQPIFVHATCKWWAMAKIKHSKLSYINDNKNREQAQIIYTRYCRILIDSSLWWFWAHITALVRKQCGLFLLFKSMDKMIMWRYALVMENFIFIPIFGFRCVVLCSLINITISTVHLKLLITAVCANIPAKTSSLAAFKNLWIILFILLGWITLHTNLLPIHFIYCYRRAGCLLNSAVGTGEEDKKIRTKILWEGVVNKQFTHWLKCVASLTGINLYKKHPELADLEDSSKFHDNVCGQVKPPTPSSTALFVFHLVICINRSKDANSSFHPFSWYTKTGFGS